MRYLFFNCLLVSLFSLPIAAQIGDPDRADGVSLQEQFDEMLRVSNRFTERSTTFKVVRQPFLESFMNNVNDSISIYTEEIADLKSTITTQASKVQEQTSDITERDNTIATLQGEKQSMTFLGVQIDKTLYGTIVWSIIGILLAAFLFAMVRMRYAASSAKEANVKAAKLEEELDQSKRRRLEVEQSLRRQLQDEINKRNAV